MKTSDLGRQAEVAVAKKLSLTGHEIVNLNWRTPRCEIDVVSRFKGAIYFTEVKYRATDQHGSGFEHITAKKLQQMSLAAEIWVQENNWTGDYRLQAAEVTGLNFENIRLSEI